MATQQKGRGSRSETPQQSTTSKATANDRGRSSLMNWRDAERDNWMDPIQRVLGSFGLAVSGNRSGEWNIWSPQIETFQRDDQLVIRADLPGLSKDDVIVEVTDDAVTIRGERRDEFVDDRNGVYRSERIYGSFHRTIPLPEGAITDNVKATFKDGVLEIAMPAPPREVNQGRRIEVTEGSSAGSAPRGSERGRPQTENMPTE